MTRMTLWISGGALAGFLYYYFVGCHSGSCPIQSNPVGASFYGALFGFAFSTVQKKKEQPPNQP